MRRLNYYVSLEDFEVEWKSNLHTAQLFKYVLVELTLLNVDDLACLLKEDAGFTEEGGVIYTRWRFAWSGLNEELSA